MLFLGRRLYLLVAIVVFANGCTRERQAPIILNTDEEPVEKHSVQARENGHCKAERWFNCTATIHDPLEVIFRIGCDRSQDSHMHGVAHLDLMNTEGTKLIKHVEEKVVFEECARMKRRKERAYDDSAHVWGEAVDFPPGTPCWQVSLVNPFGSLANRGKYLITSRLTLDDGSDFQFDPIVFEVLR
jgi:hypothetical protein